nr:peroxidase 27-like [Tanacetum cinerariifolium]GEY82585.1 peroxidase 27-like [Tanacetum cinerariifolium]
MAIQKHITLGFQLLLVALLLNIANGKGLNLGFYKKTCPRAEAIVKRTTANFISRAPSLAAPLLRMHFHDCFVRGCDGSVLLNSTKNNQAEKSGIPNLSLRGFQVIDAAKTAVEAACPDIIGLSSDSGDINEGPSKRNMPKEGINKGPSKEKLPPLGSSGRPRPRTSKAFQVWATTSVASLVWICRCSTDEESSDYETTVETTGKDLLFNEDIIEKYVPVQKSASKKDIFKSPIPITGVVLGLANVKTLDEIV